MATLALSLGGQVLGGAVAGPFGALAGRALGALAGSAVDSALFAPDRPDRVGSDVRIIGASEGAPIPKIYGWNRVAGTIIWATDLERIEAQTSGAKATGGGGGGGDDAAVAANVALALGEGEIAHIGRIWADGKPLETEGLTIRVYHGTPDQPPDSLIVAKQGEGNAPAYRGLAYLVFERLPLARFGNRLPNITVEVCRVVGDLEPAIRAVCVIPGSTEFGYDPSPRVRLTGAGRVVPENTHMSALRSNWDISLDTLCDLCPNLTHVGLVVTWFGTDLRCGDCVVEPRVEVAGKTVEDVAWSVAGLTRETATPVTQYEGGPAYGGTPSDASVTAAIADLAARGIKTTLYPFVMMDIAHDNVLPDPYGGGAGQAPYPWRGRITCDPAPGVTGSPDTTPGAGAQVAAFMDNGFADLVTHYATLAAQAGGVDAFLVGSEMRGLSWVRDGVASFPFVDALKGLAAQVRAILPETKLTYGADWSEYSGLQPPEAPGDTIFHLDPLWADANIDAIGIDTYMPLSDWRDHGDHADLALARSIYEGDYLKANIAGGEGYDWYYQSAADRESQTRTPITDGAHGEPWIYRYKDLVNFWSRPHHDRIGGVRAATSTAWVPQSKPIWLTEIGCGAVDKGTNAPNAFGDAKSSEDKRPYFSDGTPDALMQRQALRALHEYWRDAAPAHNPVSDLYGAQMLDASRLYVWCWDARPYPAFPARADVWADAVNHATGHWLNGRIGALSTEELLAAMARDFGIEAAGVDVAPPLVTGTMIAATTSLRAASATVLEVSGLDVAATPEGLVWRVPDARTPKVISSDALVRDEGPVLSRTRDDPTGRIDRLTLASLERGRDYQRAATTAITLDGVRHDVAATDLVLDAAAARIAAHNALAHRRQGTESLAARLPPSDLGVEPGDVIAIAGEGGGPFLIESVVDGAAREISARAVSRALETQVSGGGPQRAPAAPSVPSRPLVVAAHLPTGAGETALVFGAVGDPWPGHVSIRETTTGRERVRLERQAALGEMTQSLLEGPWGLWDAANALELSLYHGHLASTAQEAVLAGANRLAVEGEDGHWEVIGFEHATLVAPGEYRLTRLLRGLEGTRVAAAMSGARVMVLDRAVTRVPVPLDALGAPLGLRAYAGGTDAAGRDIALTPDVAPALPLAPVHLACVRVPGTGDLSVSWIRRGRVSGNAWTFGDIPRDVTPMAFVVEIRTGGALVRRIETGTASATYTLAQQAADTGGPVSEMTYTVRQISPVLGPGHPATGVCHV